MVWLSFLAAITLLIGILTLGERGLHRGFLIAANLSAVRPEPGLDPIFRTEVAPDPRRWTGIVIHHLGLPSGDADRVHRLHLSYGYDGLGYHFLVGNGSGLGDGIVHVGYRWNRQLPGAHVVGPAGDHHNQHSIGICLIGNGDRRSFTESQMRSLISLVRRLQRELRLPAEAVVLHRDVASGLSSPGRFFEAARFKERLID